MKPWFHRGSLFLVLSALVVLTGPLAAQDEPRPSTLAARAALMAFAQKEIPGFAAASGPWQFRFPEDHGSHPEYRTELWRFSGSLAAEAERFGFQLTFLRVGVVPPSTPLGPSPWAARDVYWAQLAVTNAAASRTHVFERQERAARQMSGASVNPVRIWVHDWSMEARPAESDASTFLLEAAAGDMSLELHLEAARPPVTEGGLRTEAPLSPNLHGYLLTRMHATGSVRVAHRTLRVQGAAWLDRAWGSVPLPLGAVVWDRFLVQLPDGRDIIALRIRRRDGSGTPTASALVMDADGAVRLLPETHVAIDSLHEAWHLRLPEERLVLELTPEVSPSGTAQVRGVPGLAHAYIELAADLDIPARR